MGLQRMSLHQMSLHQMSLHHHAGPDSRSVVRPLPSSPKRNDLRGAVGEDRIANTARHGRHGAEELVDARGFVRHHGHAEDRALVLVQTADLGDRYVDAGLHAVAKGAYDFGDAP